MKRNANRHNHFLNFGLVAQAAISALVFLPVSFLPRVISAATILVPDDYPAIQSAINAASNGDTILVAPGIYRENVAFGGRIILKAKDPAPGATVIEAVDPAAPTIAAAGPAEISGFTIRGAANSAGIRLNYGAWEAKIGGNIIESNLDGIYIVSYGSGNSEITGNIFRDNTGYDINLPVEYNSSAGVSSQSAGNVIYLNDFHGTPYPYQRYVNYWSSQEELGYKYQNIIRRGKLGNYQPQCQTEDPDGDGIGNAPCPIGGSTDDFPLAEPFGNYEIVGNEDKFIYVALGDSYQSGEGAGNSVENTADYLNAYENGKNYPWLVDGQPVGAQTNTYTYDVNVPEIISPGGDSCHRALQNYAKINKNKLEPGIPDENIVLIDLTCSGAKIENGDQPPVVGDMASNQIASNSQVRQALDQLNQIGLTAADVDLVTIGMGGNDVKFADLVYACVLPGILRRALQEYPNPPAEINFLADQFATCENFDRFNVKSGDAISQLYSKEIWAQNKLLETFGNARVLQLNYPNILPEKEKSPVWCSGIRKEDINYARKKIKEINKKIADAFNANAADNPRLEFVNVENSLGDNALCPGDESNALANSINQNNFNAEIRRLLNLDGNGDSQSRALIDGLVSAYDDWKKCSVIHSIYINTPVPARLLLHDCDVDARWGAVVGKFNELAGYFNEITDSKIKPNFIALENSNGENAEIRFDRSKGLFHPNAKGHDIAACNVLSAYNKTSAASCLPAPAPLFVCSANGVQAGNIPFSVMPNSQIHIVAGGLGYGKPVTILHHSTQSELAVVVADNNGNIDVTITLPPASPGVHTIELRGDTSSGAAISQEIRVSYPGKPDGNGSYAVYLTGFDPNISDDGEIEKVNIDYADQTFGPYIPDENGGILVEVPLLGQTGLVEITAKSQMTGKVVETTIEAIDSNPPEITIISPENNKTYANDKILPITYQIVNNQSATGAIETKLYFDNATTTASSIDLSLQKTGNHKLKITSQDEAGNIGNASSTFVNSATIDSIIANISHYYDLKLVKTRVARDILLVSAKALKIQFAALDKLKKNNFLPAKTRLALIKTAQTAINRQIDVFAALLKKQTRFVLDPQANALLTGSLAYIKIK